MKQTRRLSSFLKTSSIMRTNLNHLKFNIISNLQPQPYPQPNSVPRHQKNILVSSPHPGSAKLIVNSVQNVLSSCGKDQAQLVDYQAALHFVDHVLPGKYVNHDVDTITFPMNPPVDLAPTKAFSPGLYEIEDVYDEDEDEDDDADQEEMKNNTINYRPQPSPRNTKTNENGAPKLVLSLNIVPQTSASNSAPKKEGDPGGDKAAITSFQLSNVLLSTQTPQQQQARLIIPEKHVSLKSQTIYDRVLSDKEISLYLLHLKENIVERFKRNEIQSAVIIVRDVTDLMEHSKKESGKRLFFGLNNLVYQLRDDVIPAILVGSCSPSLLDPKNIQKDVDFYTQIIDGNLPNFSSKGDLTMAADGSLFQTSLDSYEDFFDKVPMLPPAKTFHSLRALKGKKGSSRSSKSHHEQQFLLFQYLSQQDRDMKLRIAEINTKMILDSCITRGITLKFPVWNLVCESKEGSQLSSGMNTLDFSSHNEGLKRQAESPIEGYALELLTRGIWNYGEVDKLLKLALGSRVDSFSGEIANNDTLLKSLDLEDLEAALKIMYETDIRRCPAALQSEKDISPAEGEGGVEKMTEDVQAHSPVTTHNKPKTVFNNDDSGPLRSDDESISAELKRLGVKLNKHEKRILSTVINPDRLSVQFNDLVLPPSTKLVLQTLVTLPLLRPQFFQTGILSRSSINGVLLFGPPGTGKTMLAKAVAKSSGAWFMNVSLSDIFEKYVGEGEKNVKAIFSLARKLGGPCIIFLDEVDAVFGTRRSDSSGSSRREIMNEFMAEWDGLISNNQGLVVLGATNRPFDLDDAILRRMPRRLLVDLPTEEARLKILETHLRGETLDNSIDLNEIARKTANYSGSDLKNVCISAALSRMKECIIRDYLKSESDRTAEDSGKDVDEEQLLQKLNEIEDWGSYLSDKKVVEHQTLLSLCKRHVDIGLQECPPSLSDEMQTLIELRKWDALYGDGASKRNSKTQKGIGFGLPIHPASSSTSVSLLS